MKLRPRLSAACLDRLPAEDQLGRLLLLGLGQFLRADQLVAQPVDLAEDLVDGLLPRFGPADGHHGEHIRPRSAACRSSRRRPAPPASRTSAAAPAASFPLRRECTPPRPARTDRDAKASPSARRTPCRRWRLPFRRPPRAAKAARARPRTPRRSRRPRGVPAYCLATSSSTCCVSTSPTTTNTWLLGT